MKKVLLLASLMTAAAGLAGASTCAVLMNPNTTGNSSNTCSVTADSGYYLTSLTLTITDDYTGYQSGSPTVSYTGTLSNTSEFTGVTFCNVGTTAQNSTPCLDTIAPSSTISGLTNTGFTSFSIGINNAGNSVSGGSVTGASEVAQLTYTEGLIPVSSAPEPGSMMLLGSGLLAAGLIGRKKLAARK